MLSSASHSAPVAARDTPAGRARALLREASEHDRAGRLESAIERYEAAIDAAGGIDLAVLGIGPNGHLGFNEPAERLTGATHVAELSEETWRRNFPDLAAQAPAREARVGERPFGRAYTMGIATILQARRILLLASGVSKRGILRAALEGPVTPRNPASFLQLHSDVTLVLDREAAGE